MKKIHKMGKVERKIRQTIGITLLLALGYVGMTSLIEYFFKIVLWLEGKSLVKIVLACITLLIIVSIIGDTKNE